MKQMTLATAGVERYGKTARRAAFLVEMEQVVPWREPCLLIDPVYPKPRKSRLSVGLGADAAPWFNLSDPGVEEALYE